MMAAHESIGNPPDMDIPSDEENITDEQIQELLKQAERNLQERAKEQVTGAAAKRIPKLDIQGLPQPYVRMEGDVAHVDSRRLLDKQDRDLSNRPRKVEDPLIVKQKVAAEKKASAGSDWFNLPRTDLTPELKRDLQLLKMRGVLDPKRHYKKESGKTKAPEFSQVGTIVEGPTEFFSGRISKRDRKRTLVEEILAAEAETGRFKNKYNEVQAAKSSGKKAFYKELKAKRRKTRN